jgi:hypothetical protein
MLQCRIWGRGTGNAGEWEALTHRTQGKTTKSVASYLRQISARFLLHSCGVKYSLIYNCKGFMAWLGFIKIVWPLPCNNFGWSFFIKFAPISHPHSYTRVAGWTFKNLEGIDWCSVWARKSAFDPFHSLEFFLRATHWDFRLLSF